jgi:hypothetical protein
MSKKKNIKTAILVTWKSGKKEIYARLPYFTTTNLGFNVHTIRSYLVLKKEPYIDDRVMIEQVPVIKVSKNIADRTPSTNTPT